jgi:hypothetical protein
LKATSKKRRAKKRQTKDKKNEVANLHPRKRSKLSAEEIPTLSWDVFLSLLTENKDDAFELEAFLNVPIGGPLVDAKGGLDRAKAVSKAVWDATGYRFKYVLIPYNIVAN